MNNLEINQHIIKIGKQLLAESDINTVLSIAIDDAIRISNGERGIIILFNEGEKILFQTARNLKKEDLKHPEFEISRAIIKDVKKSGETICLHNALEDHKFGKRRSATRLQILSVICIPLCKQNELFGVIYLDNRTKAGAFTNELCQFLENFTDYISLAAFHSLREKRLLNRVSELEKDLRSRYHFESIIGHDPKMVQILKIVSKIANTDATILIQGESGTGKELIANALHFHSNRKEKPFIPINCGALPSDILESELFGHVKGAFTSAINDKAGWFERTHGGTLFLDEISEMTAELQVKFLRILQTGEYSRVGSTDIQYSDVRVIAATNQNLEKLIKEGKIRQDLYYRLNVIEIKLPPLRERKSDIPVLAQHFLNIYCERYEKKELFLTSETLDCLFAYDFPGNVRELENIIQRVVILTEENSIKPSHLPPAVNLKLDLPNTEQRLSTFKKAKQRTIEEFEQDFIINCLKASKGNISRAAKIASIPIANFHNKMKKYKVDPHQFKAL